MNKYAIIKNNQVINVIEADEAFIDEEGLDAILETEKTGIAKIGATYLNGIFDDANLFDDSGRQLSKQKEAEIDAIIQKRQETLKALAEKLNLTEEEAADLLQ